MKKILCLILALVTCAVLFAGCIKTGTPSDSPSDEPERSEQTEPADENVVEVEGVRLKLTYESRHNRLCYKTDIENLTPNTVNTVSNLVCFKDGAPLVVMHLVYFEGKTPAEVMEGSPNELSEKIVNGRTYLFFEYDENGLPGHTYVAEFEGVTYTISFASAADISALEAAFMANVRFE